MTNATRMTTSKRKIQHLEQQIEALQEQGKKQLQEFNKQLNVAKQGADVRKTRMNVRYNMSLEYSKKWYAIFLPFSFVKSRISQAEEFVIAAADTE